MMPGMLRTTTSLLLLPLLLCACDEEPVSEQDAANVLELELGGEAPSLAQSLAKTKKEAAAPEPGPEPTPIPIPTPEPKPEPVDPTFHVVVLAPGETLYGLCKKHLGDGARWREVAKLNGWSETEAGHLSAGQRVKLPIR